MNESTRHKKCRRVIQLSAIASSAALLVLAGCTANETTYNAAVAGDPPAVAVFADTTQPVRDFPQSISYIQNGDTVAGGNGFRYRSADNIRYGLQPAVEPGVFIANILTLPYTAYQQRGTVVSTGLQFPPTYTAMPPLPEAPVAPEAPRSPDDTNAAMQNGTDTTAGQPLAPDALATPTTMPAAAEQAQDRPAEVLAPTTTQPNAPAFTVAGQVMRPGMYSAHDTKLSQVVLAAGPSTQDKTKVRVQIDRPGEESASTTLDQLLSGAVDDVTVKSGDVITVSVVP